MSKNIKNILLYAVIAGIIIYIIYSFIFNKNEYNMEDLYGYYEANPSFLERAELYSMALLLTDNPKLIIENEEDKIEEIIFSIDELSFKKNKNIIYIVCKSESDIDNTITNNMLEIVDNINTGELSIFEKNKKILLANMIKDNLISLYV